MKLARPALSSVWVTVIVAACVGVTPMAIDMQLPALPVIADAFDTANTNAQLTISLFMIGFAGAQLLYGPLSDRFGRRPLLLVAMGLFFAASLVCVFAGSIETLLAGRFLQGTGAAGGMVLGRACIRDIHGPKMASAMSIVVAITGLAPILAPVVGSGILAFAGWHAIFVALAAAGAAMFAIVFLFLGETNAQPNPDATRAGPLLGIFAQLLKSRMFVGFTVMIACFYGSMFSFISAFPFVLTDVLGASPEAVGLSFGGLMFGLVIGSSLSSRISNRLGVRRMLGLGFAVMLAAAGIVAVAAALGADSTLTVVAPLGLFMLGIGMTSPNAFAGAMAPFPRIAGSASSLMGIFQWLGGAGMGALVVALHDGTARPMAFQILALLMVSLLVFVTVVRPAMLAQERKEAGEAAERNARPISRQASHRITAPGASPAAGAAAE